MSLTTLQSAVVQVNRAGSAGPVIVSIPHAGRIYPEEILAEARVPLGALQRLEDRYCDILATDAAAQGAIVIQSLHARAVADCNRAPSQMLAEDVAPELWPALSAAGLKERAGLGVIPTRLAGQGLLWRRPISKAHYEYRLRIAHSPFHEAVEQAIGDALAQHGIAILIDLHSMPPITRTMEGHGKGLIVGDLFGKSSGRWLSEIVMTAGQDLHFAVGYNRPYAGGYILSRHARPDNRIYGIQLEFDRTLYLNPEQMPDREKAAPISAWLANLVKSLSNPAAWPTELGVAAE